MDLRSWILAVIYNSKPRPPLYGWTGGFPSQAMFFLDLYLFMQESRREIIYEWEINGSSAWCANVGSQPHWEFLDGWIFCAHTEKSVANCLQMSWELNRAEENWDSYHSYHPMATGSERWFCKGPNPCGRPTARAARHQLLGEHGGIFWWINKKVPMDPKLRLSNVQRPKNIMGWIPCV